MKYVLMLIVAGACLAADATTYKYIPREYLVQADQIPDFWVSTVDGVTQFLDRQVHKGTVQQIGTTAGGRAMRAVLYGQARGGKGTTTFSGSGSAM